MTTIWRIQETPEAHNKPRSRIWTKLTVDLGVWPVAPKHKVGSVWTVDQWQTVHHAEAIWKKNKPNPYGGYDEIWEVEMVDSLTPAPVKFWYALYVEDSQGMRVWDNNNGWNYEKII